METFEYMTRNGYTLRKMAEILNKTLSEIEDMCIEYGQTHKLSTSIECDICYEHLSFTIKGKMPMQTPCCDKYVCVSCTIKCVHTIENEHLMRCPFCRKTLNLTQRMFEKMVQLN